MYTGNYYPNEEGMKVPIDYGGCAFGDEASNDRGPSDTGIESQKETEAVGNVKVGGGLLESLASAFPIGKILPDGVRGALHLDKFKLGAEELLIIALAVFLFLSKDGDKECAIILFLLLFIN